MSDPILTERRGDGAYITINRPDVGGVVTDEMAGQLARIIDDAARSAKFIVYRSTGADFCLGRDRGKNARPENALEYRESCEGVFGFYDSFRRSRVPVIAAVQGRALGMGCAVAALCDITIAAADSRFALTEMANRIFPTIAMSALIDRAGRKAVTYLTYTAHEVDAQTALSYGLVSIVTPPENLDAELDRVTQAITKEPLPAVLAAKEYISVAMDMDVRSAVGYAQNLHATINTSPRMKA